MAVDLHVVRRVKERGIDPLAFADNRLEKGKIAPVAAADAVFAQLPDVAQASARLSRHRGNNLFVGVDLFAQNDVDLAGTEPGQAEVDLELGKRQVCELELEDLDIPACVQ